MALHKIESSHVKVFTPCPGPLLLLQNGAGSCGMQKIGDLEINQDLNFERRSWVVERIAWVIAALLGFLGPGLLSKATAASPDKSFSVDYFRVERYRAPVELRFHIDGGFAKNGDLQVWLDRDFVEALQIKHIDPKPQSVQISGERFVFTFKAADAPATIKLFFHVEPNKFGKVAAKAGVVNGPEIHFSQFYMP
jgi:hypothetical protein